MSRRRRRLSLYVLHRWVGAALALFVLAIAASGLLLNHAGEWGLDRPVRSPAVLDLYDIPVALPAQGYRSGGHWFAEAGGRLYRDAMALGELGTLEGLASTDDFTLALGEAAALLLDGDGRVVERLDRSRWPGPVLRLAATDRLFLLETPAGLHASGPELLDWSRLETAPVQRIVRAEPLPPALAAPIGADARARLLSWERVLLDLHSGRLFGPAGGVAADLVALGLMLLAGSGLWMWTRHLRRQRRRGRH